MLSERLHQRPLSFLAWIIAFWSIINASVPSGLSNSFFGITFNNGYLPLNWAIVTFIFASLLFFRPLKSPHRSQ